jgi:hypothetical protein
MRPLLAMLMLALAGYAAGAEGPRVPIEATGSSVEHPVGWAFMPASGSPPMVMFHLCDATRADGCLVRGEMTLTVPHPEREVVPLEERLQAAIAGRQEGVPAPRALRSGRYDAVETFWRGEHSNHVQKQVVRADMQVSTPAGLYECMLTIDPDLFDSRLEQWRRFCGSLQLASNTPD